MRRHAAALMRAFLPVLAPLIACAHSASDAYLTLTASPGVIHGPIHGPIHGQWDVALRDLDFALRLDDDGDGRLTWGEVRHHLSQVEHYVYPRLRITDSHGRPCALQPTDRRIDAHADGSYVALLFDVRCATASAITLDYDLFFDIDPSHRGIFVMHAGANDATALLSPANARLHLEL